MCLFSWHRIRNIYKAIAKNSVFVRQKSQNGVIYEAIVEFPSHRIGHHWCSGCIASTFLWLCPSGRRGGLGNLDSPCLDNRNLRQDHRL